VGRGRRIVLAVLIGAAGLVYGLSPVDLVPEVLFGPLGLLDDLGVLGAAAFGVWRMLRGGDGRPGPAGGRPDAPRG
jgi:uncharacterized membrane protein YkvA (DUF1232 family)